MPLAVVILLLVLALIAARRIGKLRLRIWQSVAAGALAVIVTGGIGPLAALRAIELHVLIFLFGTFVVAEALVLSGELYRLAYGLTSWAQSADALVLALLFAAGLSSGLLMNDTVAVVGTPLALRLASEHRIPARPLLLALAFAITTGSVMSPVGNPQNLLIALSGGLPQPFLAFLGALGPPTLLNLLLIWVVLRRFYPEVFHDLPLVHTAVFDSDPALGRLARLSLALLALLIPVHVLVTILWPQLGLPLSWIAPAAAAPVLLTSPRRGEVLRRIDWSTLVFFVALFVLVAAVWGSGFLQGLLQLDALNLASHRAIFGISVLGSQLVSNVPLVALYLPLLEAAGAGPPALLALAAASTIAGNLLIVGAASNVIVIQSAERRGETLDFLEFARVGVPLTALNVAVYWAWLAWWF